MDGDERKSRSSWGRRVLAGAAAVVCAIPILAAITISASNDTARALNTPAYAPTNLSAAAAPSATGPSSLTRSPRSLALPSGAGSLIAVIRHATVLRTAASRGRAIAKLPTRTEFGSPEVLAVVAHTDTALGVISTLAGNGRVAWIPASTATLDRVNWQLRVSLSGRTLTVLHNGSQVQRVAVAVGRSDAPTPTGRFAVSDRLNTNDPGGPYGCCILALSAHSPHAIQGWNGGNRIAIHSTPETASIGQPVSHGCVRVTLAEGRWLLQRIPLGTQVFISS